MLWAVRVELTNMVLAVAVRSSTFSDATRTKIPPSTLRRIFSTCARVRGDHLIHVWLRLSLTSDILTAVASYNKRHLAQENKLKDSKSPEELEQTKSTKSLRVSGLHVCFLIFSHHRDSLLPVRFLVYTECVRSNPSFIAQMLCSRAD